MWLVTPKQERSDVVTVWDQTKAFALPVGCVDRGQDRRGSWGPRHGKVQVPCDPMRAALAKWLLASWLRRHVRTNEARRVHGSMGALSQRAAKLIHIDLNSLLVPKKFHAPRFAQYRGKSFNESTSHVHVHVRWNLSNCYRFNTHHKHIFRFSTLTCLLKLVRSIKRSADKKNVNLNTATPFSQNCCSLFSTSRMKHSNVWKECKRRAVSMDKSCPAVVLGEQKDWCKHRAVSMDKSCPAVVLRREKMNANTGRCLWISPARWLY